MSLNNRHILIGADQIMNGIDSYFMHKCLVLDKVMVLMFLVIDLILQKKREKFPMVALRAHQTCLHSTD